MIAFLFFALHMIRRGPQAAPSHAEASGSLKHALKPQVMRDPAGRNLAPAE
jgi:cytochrome d ubiquinol oxidase subunit I